ncbi:MAG: hypothetical protein J7J96_06985 [Sulfurimonas sp.]|nr:hypothetical protein [Sulfurimonas sp.]
MRLENILALTLGKLVNEPFVKIFENIVFDVKKVKRGDLFIAFDEEMIEDAILNGAYGVMFDKPTQISDTEIAWIKVKECEDALKRLLRFRLIEKDVTVYECNEIVLKLSLQVITEPNFIVVNGDIKSIHKQLWHVDNNSTLLFCPKMCDKNIFTDIKQLPTTAIEPITIMEQTLFETSFIYDNTFYERQLISPFFMPYLEELLHLYKTLKINYRLRKFTPINHFEAVFTNKNFEIKEFGTSDKVLIFESNTDLVEQEISFLQKNASWANLIYLIPHTVDSIEDENIFIYESSNKIIDILKNNSFHFALIIGVDKSILSKPITNQAQLTLNF